MTVPWLPVPAVPTPVLSFARPVADPGMPYITQFHRVEPSTGMVVIMSAYSFVPSGAPDQVSAGVDPAPSQLYSVGSVLPLAPALLVSTRDPVFAVTAVFTDCKELVRFVPD